MEGPSIVILCEEAQKFVGKRIRECDTSVSALDPAQFKGRTLKKLASWGKHFLLTIGTANLKVHFLMFGSYRIDAPKTGKVPRLTLEFTNGRIDFYSCAVQKLETTPDQLYDWRVDLMSSEWDEDLVIRQFAKQAREML